MVHEDYVRNSDALREQFWADSAEERREKLMPFFWSTIVGEGQLYGNRDLNNRVDVTNGRNFSYPGYNEILTGFADDNRSEEHTSELQSRGHLVCRLLLEKKKR